jgi:hypothetical protein
MLANDTAQDKTVALTIGSTLNYSNTTPMIPLMGLQLTYTHARSHANTKVTHG